MVWNMNFIFHIIYIYMGCHPSHWLSDFSRHPTGNWKIFPQSPAGAAGLSDAVHAHQPGARRENERCANLGKGTFSGLISFFFAAWDFYIYIYTCVCVCGIWCLFIYIYIMYFFNVMIIIIIVFYYYYRCTIVQPFSNPHAYLMVF